MRKGHVEQHICEEIVARSTRVRRVPYRRRVNIL